MKSIALMIKSTSYMMAFFVLVILLTFSTVAASTTTTVHNYNHNIFTLGSDRDLMYSDYDEGDENSDVEIWEQVSKMLTRMESIITIEEEIDGEA